VALCPGCREPLHGDEEDMANPDPQMQPNRGFLPAHGVADSREPAGNRGFLGDLGVYLVDLATYPAPAASLFIADLP